MSTASNSAELFSGRVERFVHKEGATFRERFDLMIDIFETGDLPEANPDAIDSYTVFRQPKLGPAVIYQKALPTSVHESDIGPFFEGNLAASPDGGLTWLELQDQPPLDDDEFWRLISLAGSRTRDRWPRLIATLRDAGEQVICRFQNSLAQKLWELDHPANALVVGAPLPAPEEDDSDEDEEDRSLDLRSAIILEGPDSFVKLRKNPGSRTWSPDMAAAGEILAVAPMAYAQLTGGSIPVMVTSLPYDAGSNTDLWGTFPDEHAPIDDSDSAADDDADGVAEWYEENTPELIEMQWDKADRVWDNAAAHGWRWMTARFVVHRDDRNFEVLVFLGAPFDWSPSAIRAKATQCADDENLGRIVSPVELYDTHYERPAKDMAWVFVIERVANLSTADYWARYLP